MLEFVSFLQSERVVAFLLLFFRFGALFTVAPIFSHTTIPMRFKVAMSFFFTVIFFPFVPLSEIPMTLPVVLGAIFSELLFGFVVGLALQVAYNVITFAGGVVSFTMGFSLATAIDPQNGVSMPIISQFLSLIALMVLFSLNLHHWLILYISQSLQHVPLGGFILAKDVVSYVVEAAGRMFLVGFMIAFPIVALSLLADVIFGMLMKTMPQFNLLVIGFPIKIMVSFVVLIAVLASIIVVFKGEVINTFNNLELFF